MRKLVAQTFAIQGIGVALMFAVTLLVSRLGGPEAQGSFALVKSSTDLLVGFFSLGMPSAIIYLLNKSRSGHGAIYRHSLRYGALLSVALPLLIFAVMMISGAEADMSAALIRSAAIGFAAAWLTQLALLRSVLLVYTDGLLFSSLAVVQWLVLALVVLPLLNSSPYVFEIAYCATGAVCVAIVMLYLRRFGVTPSGVNANDSNAIDWSILRQQSGHVFLQTALFGLQPFLTNAVLARHDPSLTDAGLFNIASLFITLPNLLVALVAPVLFNRWSRSLDWAGMTVVVRNACWIGAVGQVAALCALPLVEPVINLIFGASFAPATSSTQIMLLAALAIITGRILTPALQGLGLTHVATWSCVARITVGACTAFAELYLAATPPLLALAISWCAGEYVALGVLLLRVKRGLAAH